MAKKEIWSGDEPFLRKGEKVEKKSNKNILKDNAYYLIFAGIVIIVLIILYAFGNGDDTIDESIDNNTYETEEIIVDNSSINETLNLPKINEVSLTLKNYIFEPEELIVPYRERTIVHVKSVQGNHSIRIAGMNIYRTIPLGEEISFEINPIKPGKYIMEDPYYDNMRGYVIVEKNVSG